MKIGYTLAAGRSNTNVLLTDVALRLADKGLRLCGTIQIDSARSGDDRCDMDVRVLPNGPEIRISQSLGIESRGCQLDPSALEDAVGLTLERLTPEIDVLIVNKFGKHEAEGRGFRDAIMRAVELGIPILIGANKLNLEALIAFCPDAEALEPDPEILVAWATRNSKR